MKKVSPACYIILSQYLCGVTYPKCSNGTLSFICQTTCDLTYRECLRFFTSNNIANQLPNCTQPVPHFNVAYPTEKCMEAQVVQKELVYVEREDDNPGGSTVVPLDHFLEDEIPTSTYILDAFHLASLLSFIDMIIAFSSLRKNWSVVFFSFAGICFAITILTGQIKYQWNINNAMGQEFCRSQAISFLYFEFLQVVFNAMVGMEAWIAITRRHVLAKSPVDRLKYTVPFAIIIAAVPTIIMALKANPLALHIDETGWGPRTAYCFYIYPLDPLKYSSIPYNLFFSLFSLVLGMHSTYHLYYLKTRFDSAGGGSSASGSSGGGTGGSGETATRRMSGVGYRNASALALNRAKARKMSSVVSRQLIWRILGLTVVTVIAYGSANFLQFRAVINGNYSPSDIEPGPTDYIFAAFGTAAWLLLATTHAAWPNTILGRLLRHWNCGKGRDKNGENMSYNDMCESPTSPTISRPFDIVVPAKLSDMPKISELNAHGGFNTNTLNR
ncbi:hypothetical protein HK104_005141, partial [Borealophlyctis nickersoniae]